MKIELIKEVEGVSKPKWYTNVDDRYVSSSLSFNEEEATAIYKTIVLNKGELSSKEVIKSETI